MLPQSADHLRSKERRIWLISIGVGVVAHIILIGFLVFSSRDIPAGTVQDVPIMPAGVGEVSGVRRIPDPRPLNISCTYIVYDEREVARLSSGPPRVTGVLGCKDTFELSQKLTGSIDVVVDYSSQGQLRQINGQPIEPGDTLARMVRSWELATPRPGRQWPGLPTFRVRIVPR